MVVEHTFVTTRDWNASVLLVTGVLTRYGYASNAALGFAIDPGLPQVVSMARGKKQLKGLMPVISPTQLRMVYDRGRVNLAISMDDPSADRQIRLGGGRALRRKRQNRESYLVGLANVLDELVTGRITPAEADAWMLDADENVRTLRRGDVRKTVVYPLIFLAVIAAAVIVIAVFASHR